MKANSLKCVMILFLYISFLDIVDASTVHLKDYARPGTDVSLVLQRLVDENDKIIIDRGIWMISEAVYLRPGVEIKGEDKERSILKASEEAIVGKRNNFCIFATTRMKRSAISWRNLPESQYDYHIKNVKISNLTFDLNRRVEYFLDNNKLIKDYGVVAVRFENCDGAIITNCIIVDHCRYDESENNINRIAAVYLMDCKNCKVSKCKTTDCTFVYVVFGKNNVIETNKGENTWGTWIETVDGAGHIIRNNEIRNVWCRVSTIGVNSKNCEVVGNVVENNTRKEISCLTLGHDDRNRTSSTTKADGTTVHGNRFITNGNLGLLVQSGSDLAISSNYIQVEPNDNSSFHAGIGIAGDESNFNGIRISKNTINIATGFGFGIVGQNMNDASIFRNKIGPNLKCGIKLWKSAKKTVLMRNKVNGAKTPIDTTKVNN